MVPSAAGRAVPDLGFSRSTPLPGSNGPRSLASAGHADLLQAVHGDVVGARHHQRGVGTGVAAGDHLRRSERVIVDAHLAVSGISQRIGAALRAAQPVVHIREVAQVDGQIE